MRPKTFIITVALFCSVHQLQAQSITPQVLPTQGRTDTAAGIGLTWTIGEPFTMTFSGGGVTLTLGFQQPEMILPPVAPAAQTVYSDTAYTFTFSNVTAGGGADEIEWARNANFDSSIIVGSPVNISMIVIPGRRDTVWMRSRNSRNGHSSGTVYTDGSVLNPEVIVSIRPLNLMACQDTLFDTIALYNIASPKGFSIYQVLPEGAVVLYTSSSCLGFVDTLYQNHVFAGNTDSIKWSTPPDTINTCLLIAAIGFNCATGYPNGGSNNGLTTIIDTSLHVTDTSGLTYGLEINNPAFTVANITPATPSDYALKGDTEIHEWKICASSGRIENLTITYVPEQETNSENIHLGLAYNANRLIKILTGGALSYTFPAPLDSLTGHNYLDSGQCIIVTDTAIDVACSGAFDQDTLEASINCPFGGDCSGPVLATAKVFVHDDLDALTGADNNSAISMTGFQLFQDDTDVTGTGILPCGNPACAIKYVFNNPVRSNDSLPPNANYKILQSFSTFISTCWFNTDTMQIHLCDVSGSHCIVLSGKEYKLVHPGNLTIYFDSLGSEASNIFSQPSSVYADTAYNEMHENSEFTISITGLAFNQHCSLLNDCNHTDNSILGSSTLAYYTMCSNSPFTPTFGLGNYSNNIQNSAIFATTNDIKVGQTFALNFGWNNADNNANPWNFLNGNNPLFDCHNPVYTMNILVPTDFNYTFNRDSIFFQVGTGAKFPFDTSQITGPTLQVMQGDTFNVYVINSISEPGNVIASVTFEGGPKCNGQGGYDTAYAEIFAACDAITCPDDLYCVTTESNVVYYHCQGQCEYPIGLDSINPVVVGRILIPSEHTGTGPTDSSQAYPCDTVMVTAKGFANHNYITGLADSIYLRITYDPDTYLTNSNTLFNVASADYSVDAVHWTPVASTPGPRLYTSPVDGITRWMVDACLPGGCDSSSVSSVFMLNDTVFYIRVKLLVNDLQYTNGGLYFVDDIRADMRVTDCNDTDYHSCDTYAGNETLIQHQYNVTANFIAPDDASSDNAPKVNICTQRLVIVAEATGGFTQKQEMPNETRPLIIWPNNSGPGDTLQLFASSASMILKSAKFRAPDQSSSYDTLGTGDMVQNAGTVSFLGVGGAGWPVYGKDTLNLFWMQLEATFDKLDCANAAQTDSIHFNYWVRGQGSQCLSAPAFFGDTAVRDTTMLVTTYSTSDAVTLLTHDEQNGIYDNNALVTAYLPVFDFNSILQYNGRAAGANYTWLYAVIPPQIDSLKLIFNDGSVETIDSGRYSRSGPVLLPPGADTIRFRYYVNLAICNGDSFAIDFYSGYSCDSAAIPTGLSSIPDSTSFSCGVTHSRVMVGPQLPFFDGTGCSGCSATISGDFCSDFDFSFALRPLNTAAIYNPANTISIPPHTILKSVKLQLTCDGNFQPGFVEPAPLTITVNETGGPGVFYSCTDSLQSLLMQYGDTFNGLTFMDYGCVFSVEPVFTGINDSSNGTITDTIFSTGENWCGAPMAYALEQIAVMIFSPLTIDSFRSNLCTGSDSVTVNIIPGIANYIYAWTGAGFAHSDTLSATAETVLITDTGMYYVTVKDSPGCSVTDSVHIIQVVPVYDTANAGASVRICAGDSVTLAGSVSGDTVVGWTTSGNGHFTDTAILNPFYIPGATDISNGSVVLTLTAFSNPRCITYSDTMVVMIQPLDTPAVGISYSPWTLCAGDTALLYGYPSADLDSVHYNWYVNGVLVSGTSTTGIYPYPLQNNDTAVYTIMRAFGTCLTPDTVQSAPYPMIVYRVVLKDSIVFPSLCSGTNYGEVNILVTEGYTPYHYLWSNSDTSSGITGLSSGTYSVSVQDDIGCVAADTVTIALDSSCCIGDMTFGTITSSQLSTLLNLNTLPGGSAYFLIEPTANITFNDTLFIDNNFEFFVCKNVTFGPGALVYVKPGATFNVVSSNLAAGCDTLWRGIQVAGGTNPGSLSVIAGSIIKDAQYGIEAFDKSIISVQNTTFNNNFIGLYFNGIPNTLQPPRTLTMPLPFIGNTFNGDTLLPVYPGMVNTSSQPPASQVNKVMWGWAGIETDYLQNMNIGTAVSNINQSNSFYGLANGIFSFVSNLNVQNSYFNRIQNRGYQFALGIDSMEGNGIMALGITTLGATHTPKFTLTETGTGRAAIPTFYNCVRGIVADKMNITATANVMEDVTGSSMAGIIVKNSPDAIIRVNGNSIFSAHRGIQLLNNDPHSAFAVVDNNYVAITGRNGAYDGVGIELQETNLAPLTLIYPQMQYDTIEMLTGGSVIGALLNGCNYWAADNNVVMMEDPAHQWYGIQFANCGWLNTKDNIVTGVTRVVENTDSTRCPVGMFYASNPGFRGYQSFYGCNTVKDLFVGVRFTGPNLNAIFTTNNFNDPVSHTGTCDTGLLVEASATIDAQIDKANKWWGSYQMAAKNDNTSINGLRNEQFDVVPVAPYLPPSISPPSGWFFIGTDTTAECVEIKLLPPATVDSLTSAQKTVIYDSLTFDRFNSELVWQNANNVYTALRNNLTLLDSGADVAQFYYAKDSGTIGMLARVSDMEQFALQPDSLTALSLAAAQDSVNASMQMLSCLDSARALLMDTTSFVSDSIASANFIAWMDSLIEYGVTEATKQTDIAAYASSMLNTVTDTAAMNALNSQIQSTNIVLAAQIHFNDSIKSHVDSLINLRLLLVIDSNTMVATDSAIEEGYKDANTIFLNSLTQSDTVLYDNSALSALYSLAFECPLKGGEAVYKARAMLSLVLDTIYEDDAICAQAELRDLKVKPKNPPQALKVNMYPNPANNYVILQLNQDIQPLQLRVIDMMGSKIVNASVSTVNGLYILNTSAFSSGMYYVTLSSSGNKLYGGRLNIFSK